MMSVHPIGEQWTHIASTPFPALLLSSRRRRIVRVEGHAWVCTQSAWVRGVHTRLGLSTCKCQWRLKIGRLSCLSLSLSLSHSLRIYIRVSWKSKWFLRRRICLFNDLDILRLDQTRLRYVGWCTLMWRQVGVLVSLWYCVNDDIREERRCNWLSLLDSLLESLKLSLIEKCTLTNDTENHSEGSKHWKNIFFAMNNFSWIIKLN